MLYLAAKAILSGAIVAVVSEIAKRSPTLGALVASLPLVSLLAVIWLWRDSGDDLRVASLMEATFWYILPSLPMFLLVPALLRGGVAFWPGLAIGCIVTFLLYLATAWLLSRIGVQL